MSLQVNAQVITIHDGEKIEQAYQLKSSEYEVDPAKINMAFSYDMDLQELMVKVSLNKGSYDMLWIPLRSYDEQMLKDAVGQKLNGKAKLEKPLSRKIVFGLGSTFDCRNCELLTTTSGSIADELHKVKDTAVYRFRVIDPQEIVRIVLCSAVPVQSYEMPSGNVKYMFKYVADRVAMDLRVPSDPCKMEANVALLDSVNLFYNAISVEIEKMQKAINENKREDCLDCKDELKKKYEAEYDKLKAQYDSMPKRCEQIDTVLKNIASIYKEKAEELECPKHIGKPGGGGTVVPPDPPLKVGQTAKEIKKLADGLTRCTNAIRSGREVKKNKELARQFMAKAGAIMNSLSEEEKGKQQVQDAVKLYKLAEKGYQMQK